MFQELSIDKNSDWLNFCKHQRQPGSPFIIYMQFDGIFTGCWELQLIKLDRKVDSRMMSRHRCLYLDIPFYVLNQLFSFVVNNSDF